MSQAWPALGPPADRRRSLQLSIGLRASRMRRRVPAVLVSPGGFRVAVAFAMLALSAMVLAAASPLAEPQAQAAGTCNP